MTDKEVRDLMKQGQWVRLGTPCGALLHWRWSDPDAPGAMTYASIVDRRLDHKNNSAYRYEVRDLSGESKLFEGLREAKLFVMREYALPRLIQDGYGEAIGVKAVVPPPRHKNVVVRHVRICPVCISAILFSSSREEREANLCKEGRRLYADLVPSQIFSLYDDVRGHH